MAELKKICTLKLKVAEPITKEDIGRGIIRIDSDTMNKLGIKEGEIVEIEGKRRTCGVAFISYSSDKGLNIIRMDGLTRRNAGSGVGEFVKIRKAEVKDAKEVTLAPVEKNVIVRVSSDVMKKRLYGRPLVKGDIIEDKSVSFKEKSIFEDFFGEDFFWWNKVLSY
jgi:transitional endoplasmic reticulum ATPase